MRDRASDAPYEDEAVNVDLHGHLLTSEHRAKWLAASETCDSLVEEGERRAASLILAAPLPPPPDNPSCT